MFTGDKINNIKTLPVRYGINTTRNLIIILGIISVAILFSGYFLFNVFPLHHVIIISIFTLLITYYYFDLTKKGKNFDQKFLCNVIVDGEYVLLGVIALISLLIFNLLV